jgi:hypothetical protein
MVMANPADCCHDNDWSSTSHPRMAPVTGDPRPSSGGAADGNLRMPLNHTRKASAVPTRLRYANPATFSVLM